MSKTNKQSETEKSLISHIGYSSEEDKSYSSSYNDPVSSKFTTVHIFGAGDAGIAAALFHLKAGYKVHLYEKEKANSDNKLSAIRNHASRIWSRQHGGAEYPTDEETAINLLDSSIVMSKILSETIYNNYQGSVSYPISWKAQKEGIRTVEKQKKVMEKVKEEYKKKCNKDKDSGVYGSPDEFIKLELDGKEFDKNQFAGGIKTNERGINPVVMTKVLTDMLETYVQKGQLVIHDDCNITQIQRIELPKTKFLYKFENANKEVDAELIEGRVVNCTGISTLNIACQLHKNSLKDRRVRGITIFFRAMGIANISKVEQKNKNYACFPMGAVQEQAREDDVTCGMFSDINGELAYIYGPSKQICYLPCGYDKIKDKHFIQLTLDKPEVPKEFWIQIASDLGDVEQRKKELTRRMHKTYKGLENAKIIELITAPLVVVDYEMNQNCEDETKDEYVNLTKRCRKNNILGDDLCSETIFLEKGTDFMIKGLESLKNTLKMEVLKNNLSENEANEIFSRFCCQTIYEDNIDSTKVNPEALLSKSEKLDLKNRLKSSDYQKELLELSQEHFGKNVGRKLISHILSENSVVAPSTKPSFSSIAPLSQEYKVKTPI